MALFNFQLTLSDSQFDKLVALFLPPILDIYEAINRHRHWTGHGFEKVAKAISDKLPELPPDLTITGGDILKFIKNDHPDVPGKISQIIGRDAEGEEVTLIESLTSDNEEVQSFVFAEGSNTSNPREFVRHTGRSGVANLNYTATDPKGNIVKSAGEQVTVSTGDVIVTEGGDVDFGVFEENVVAPPE